MSKDGQKSPSGPKPTVVFMTIADTTWRMFVPSIGFTLLGMWLDSEWGTTPWLMFIGIIIGLVIAALAVWLQYKRLVKQ